jgi:hypothetical protein
MKFTVFFCALYLASFGICFAQDGQHAPSTRQTSSGSCSINAANVRGSVNATFTGSACNGLSKSIENELHEAIIEMQNVAESCRASDPTQFLTSLPAGLNLPTVIDADALKLPDGVQNLYFASVTTPIGLASAFNSASLPAGLNLPTTESNPLQMPDGLQNFYSSSGTPIKLASAFDISKIAGITDWSNTIPMSSVSAFPTGLSLQSISGLAGSSMTLDSISLSVTKITLTNDLIGSSTTTFQSKMPSDLVNGLYDARGSESVLAGVPIPASNSTSLTFTSASSALSFNGSNQLLASNVASDSIGYTHLAGVESPIGLSLSNAGLPPLGTQANLISSSGLASTTTIAGTDYASLSKNLSDLTSSGHIVTGWTVTYLTTQSH